MRTRHGQSELPWVDESPRKGPRETIPHRCHATGCLRRVPAECLFCRDHWRMVPGAIRKGVWATYRPGQCDDMKPSREWHEAADAAIGWVARREGRHVTVAQTEALVRFGE